MSGEFHDWMEDPHSADSVSVNAAMEEFNQKQREQFHNPDKKNCSCDDNEVSKVYNDFSELINDIHPLKDCEDGLLPKLDIDLALADAKKASEKNFPTLEELGKAKDLCSIERLLRNSKYPEDADCSTHKSFISILLFKRCKLMLSKDSDYEPRHDLCLRDLRLIEQNWMVYLPSADHHLLFYFQTACLMKLKLYGDAKLSLEKARDTLERDHEKKDCKMLKKYRKKLLAGMTVIVKNDCENKAPISQPKSVIPSLDSTNPDYPALSKSVSIKNHVKAKSGNDAEKESAYYSRMLMGAFAEVDIPPGEIIVIDEPIEKTPRPKRDFFKQSLFGRRDLCKAREVCHSCLGEVYSMSMPCSGCSQVSFCSLECRDSAKKGFHKYECKMGIQHLNGSWRFMQFASVVLRAIFSLDSDQFKAMAKDSNPSGNNKIMKLLELAKYSESSKEKPPAFVRIIANNIWEIVKRSGLIIDVDDKDINIFWPKTIEALTNVQSLHMRELRRPRPEYFPISKELPHKVPLKCHGQGIFKTLSLISNSCVANAEYFEIPDGRTIVFTTRAITKDEEITIPYNSSRHLDFVIDRWNPLRHCYRLICDCLACEKKLGPMEFRYDALRKRKDMANALPEEEMEKHEEKEEEFLDSLDVEGLFRERVRRSLEVKGKMSAESYCMWGSVFAHKMVSSLAIKYGHV